MMKKLEIYKDYPVHPYISPKRDVDRWIEFPEEFPYKKVEIKQMVPLEEGLLAGDIILLWRVSLNTFTNQSMFPDYFEYKYGINASESLTKLENSGYIRLCTASESLDSINAIVLKRILKKYNLSQSGKKQELLNRVREHLDEKTLASAFTLRDYRTTHEGNILLEKYYDLVLKHGPKM